MRRKRVGERLPARLHGPDGTPTYVATQNDDSTEVFRQTSGNFPRAITPALTEAYAEIVFPDSSVQRRELYYGSGYLSQSSRRFPLPTTAEKVTLHSYTDTTRTVTVDTE